MALTTVGYQFRTNDADLITSTVWNANENTPAAIQPDVPFRLRVEIETSDLASIPTGTLQYRLDKSGVAPTGAWENIANNPTYDTAGSVNGQVEVMAIPSTAYSDLVATTDLLSQGAGTFVAGSGSHDNSVPAVNGTAPFHTEHEFCLIVRKLSEDGHVPDDTVVQFRYLTSAPSETFLVTPQLSVLNRPGHIGGSAVETMHRNLVETAEGVLYTLVEFADTNDAASVYSNEGVMMKSAPPNAGDVWVPVDQDDQTERDMEAADLVYEASTDTIHVFIQNAQGATDLAQYRKFFTSGHPTTPDTWDGVDTWEVIETSLGATVGQFVSGHVRSDGTIVATYSNANGGTATADRSGWYNIRSIGGTWGTPAPVPGTTLKPVGPPSAVLDEVGAGNAADAVHMFYIDQSTGTLYHRALAGPAHSTNADAMSPRSSIDTGLATNIVLACMVTPPIIWNDGGTLRVGVLYGKATTNNSPEISGFSMHFASSAVPSDSFSGTYSWTSERVDGNEVTGQGIGSRTLAAGMLADGSDVTAVWSDFDDKDAMSSTRTSGVWSIEADEFTGNYLVLRVSPITNGIGVVSDASTAGGTGTFQYDSIVTAATVPDAVADLAGVAGDGEVVLTWTAPADGGSAITDYIVQYRGA